MTQLPRQDLKEEKYSQLLIDITAHQLRSSLSSANWYMEMLLEKADSHLNADEREYLLEVNNAHERMSELVNTLLSMAKIELGTFIIKPEPMDLKALATKLLGMVKPKVLEKKLKFEQKLPEGPFIFECDPKVLAIVLENLISNAVKYTPTDGRVMLEVSKNDKNVLIKVSDTGYGIPKEQQDKIFTRFFRADNVQLKQPDGNGLGLYIVKTLVEKMGGRVWFESEENKGTTFFVELPIEAPTEKIS